MKRGVVIIVLLVAVLAAAPFGFSFWAEKRLNNLMAEANKSGLLDMTVIKMERGWFSSNALIEVELDASLSNKVGKMDKRSGDVPNIVLKNTIHHGPFPFMSGHFSPVPVVASVDTKFMKSLTSDEPLITFDYTMMTDLLMTGKNHINMDIPEWSGPVDEGKLTLEWKGLQGDIAFSDNLDDADMDIKAPYLKLHGKQGTMLLESFEVESDSEIGIEGLSLGTAKFKIGKIVVNDTKTGADFKVDGFDINVDTGAAGDNVYSNMKFDIASFELSGDRFGPGVFSMAFRNLDAGAVARISDKYKNVSQQANMPPEQMSMMMGTTLLSEMSTLLKKGPEIEIGELSLASNNGKLMGTAKVTVDTSKPDMLSNPLLIKDAIIGEVDLEVPEALMVDLTMATMRQEFKTVDIQYTEEQLKTMAQNRVNKRFAPLVGANLFTKVGDTFKFNASFKNGVPVVNGKPLQIPLGGGAMPPGR